MEELKDSHYRALESSVVLDDYKSQVLLENAGYIFSKVGYPRYPVRHFEKGEYYFLIEGKMFGKNWDSVQEELGSIAERLFDESSNIKEELSTWLLNTDGDFVVFILHRPSNRLAIFNDVFSRLPLYYFRSEDRIIISRNFTFMAGMLEHKRFDRMAIAQWLLFNYAFGQRTLLENVKRVGPAGLIRIEMETGRVTEQMVHEWNFEIKEHKDKSIAENAEQLAHLFMTGCKNRVDGNARTVLSLSGGLDSRLIAGSLKHEGVEFEAVSWLDCKGVARLDVNTAEKVADTLGIKWCMYQLKPATGEDVLRLLKSKGGQNYLVLSRALQHYDNIKKLAGPEVTFFTGNCGDRITCDLRPKWELETLDDAVDYILKEERQLSRRGDFSVEQAAEIAGVSAQAIIDELKERLSSYPENDLAQKVIHFVIYEQCFKRYFEGDDRARANLWNVSPFWSVHFFKYIYNCPDAQKKDWRLYSDILSRVDNRLCRIKRAINYRRAGVPILMYKPLWQRILIKARNAARRIPRLAKRIVKGIKGIFAAPVPEPSGLPFIHSSDLIRCVQEQLKTCEAVGRSLSVEAIDKILECRGEFNSEAMGLLFTMTSAIEYLSGNRSTIEKYLSSDLDTYGNLRGK